MKTTVEKKKSARGQEYTVVQGNVFEALGLADADELLWKANPMSEIGRLIKAKKLTQKQVAVMVGLDQSEVSRLVNGSLTTFSVERLLMTLNRLGHRVEVRVLAREVEKSDAQTVVLVA